MVLHSDMLVLKTTNWVNGESGRPIIVVEKRDRGDSDSKQGKEGRHPVEQVLSFLCRLKHRGIFRMIAARGNKRVQLTVPRNHLAKKQEQER